MTSTQNTTGDSTAARGSLLDRPRPESRTNGLAPWGLALAVLVWPVGLIVSAVALFRARRLGGAGTSQAVLGLIIAPVLALITFSVLDTTSYSDTRKDPACQALRSALPALDSDLTSQPSQGQLAQDEAMLRHAEATAQNATVRDGIQAVRLDVQMDELGKDALPNVQTDANHLNDVCGG
ncbi:DUF485 domain-containing protein [Streptacidiphilus fuscans]|uniref:DUF4190 domain-containing protein n=1 Tax=Streptacidiphilus fuscans TaxID=2789292 RepID=A0A931B6F9_9ACTN|nr:hypothetical protein [Streptacidiphilus fuscans]MBF9070312.1 hypothetical protein [Streptacidiphilus fuscans]